MVCLTYKYKTKFSTGSSWLKSKDGRDQTKQKMYTWSVSWNLFLQNYMLNVEWASPFSSGRHYFPDVSSQGIITVSLQTWSPTPPSCRHSVLSSPVRGRLAFHLPSSHWPWAHLIRPFQHDRTHQFSASVRWYDTMVESHVFLFPLHQSEAFKANLLFWITSGHI